MTDVDPEETHVTRRELNLELRSFRNEMRVLIVGAIVVLRFDVPEKITAAAVIAAIAAAAAKAVFGTKV